MFNRDLLVFDVESTGTDTSKHEIIQIAGIRLDKDSLEERARFSTYVKPNHWETRDMEAMQVNKISYDLVATAPTLAEALALLEKNFPPAEVLLCAYNIWFDVSFLRQAYFSLGKPMSYNYAGFDILALGYIWWCKTGQQNNPEKYIGFGMQDLAHALGINAEGAFHNALTDVVAEAEILRRLAHKVSIHDA
jgi:DNA helicase-2/ATP-dependent DNA helicase PcrA